MLSFLVCFSYRSRLVLSPISFHVHCSPGFLNFAPLRCLCGRGLLSRLSVPSSLIDFLSFGAIQWIMFLSLVIVVFLLFPFSLFHCVCSSRSAQLVLHVANCSLDPLSPLSRFLPFSLEGDCRESRVVSSGPLRRTPLNPALGLACPWNMPFHQRLLCSLFLLPLLVPL